MMSNQETKTNTYRVKLGHEQVTVQAGSAAEAIALARRLFAAEMPRFYDVINSAEAALFEVKDAA
jgi:hypothetical protein